MKLAEQIEAAEGPSRELDEEISKAVRGFGYNTELRRLYGPAYTASLDAAMTLVPEGWAYRVDYRPDGLDLPRGADPEPALGMVYRGIGQAATANAATPALALCAAALRARQGGTDAA